MNEVIVVIGAGSIGQAVARRIGAGKRIALADRRHETAQAAAKTLGDGGRATSPARVNAFRGRRSVSWATKPQRRARMIALSAAGRGGTPDEVAGVGALLMGADGAFITGSDFLIDGGVTAAYWYGELAPG